MLETIIDGLAHTIEAIGVIVIAGGIVIMAARLLIGVARGGDRRSAVADFRSDVGRSILLGLEFLVAADIIDTVRIEPSLEQVAALAGIVLIRTFLSFSLEVEIDGRWPWQKDRAGAGLLIGNGAKD